MIDAKATYLELTESINCVPSGVYKVEDIDDESVHLSATTKVQIRVIGDYGPYVRPVDSEIAVKARKTPEQFVNEYYELYDAMRNAPLDWEKPITMCFLHPSLDLILN